jgi:DNA-binding NarL/FixJ family response regulator
MAFKKKTVLIADDHPIFRQGLKHILSSVDWLQIIAEAENGDSALIQIEHFHPDMVILDLAMPGKDGLSVLQEATQNHPEISFIILTSYDDSAYLERSLELGARAYLVKDGASDDIVQCMEAVYHGETYISPALGARSAEKPPVTSAQVISLDSLTEMERKVLAMVAHFMTSKEIAKELGISYRTVQSHRSNICTKLKIKGTHQLMSFAREQFKL